MRICFTKSKIQQALVGLGFEVTPWLQSSFLQNPPRNSPNAEHANNATLLHLTI